jgi:hypothetical protein
MVKFLSNLLLFVKKICKFGYGYPVSVYLDTRLRKTDRGATDMHSSTNNTTPDPFSTADLRNALQPGQWLKLEDLPSPFAQDEALLLCRVSRKKWVTWVPEHGEYLLAL